MSQRMPKVNSMIEQKLNLVFKENLEFPLGSLVTITNVDAASDLKTAKVYLSIFPQSAEQQALEVIEKNKSTIQKELGKSLTIRFTPKLNYVIDNTENEAAKIDDLLNSLNKNSNV